jgi:excisionase family DNA binding protein
METRARSEKRTAGLVDLIGAKPRALRVNEVAALLSVSERLVYRLAAERLIPAFRIGNSLRFDPAALAAWLRQTMASPSPKAPQKLEGSRPSSPTSHIESRIWASIVPHGDRGFQAADPRIQADGFPQ